MHAAEAPVGYSYATRGTTITVLREPEPCEDLFGRTMIRFWARRADTGAEGWMTYGPAAHIDRLEPPS
jgi:hypothetical protein